MFIKNLFVVIIVLFLLGVISGCGVSGAKMYKNDMTTREDMTIKEGIW
jgi:hypothetical protein